MVAANKMLRLRPFPNFKLELLPNAEHKPIGQVRVNVGSLAVEANSFWSGRALLDHCQFWTMDPANGALFSEWQKVAARDCAMSIYHFGRLIEGIDEWLGRCPTARTLIDQKAKSSARKSFERTFPSYIDMRDGLSHSAERSAKPKDHGRHSINGKVAIKIGTLEVRTSDENDSFLLMDTLHEDKLYTMWERKVIECDVSEQSGEKLDAVVDQYWAAFGGLLGPPEPPPTITRGTTLP